MKNWYVVHTQTGFEDRVKTILQSKISASGFAEHISKVVIPTEQISEVRSGKKRVTERRFFPGYILVEMEMNDQAYSFIKGIPGVTGFIGSGKKPTPLPPNEVDSILKRTEETKAKPSPKIIFEKGEAIRVKEGPFMNFNGTIDDVYPDKGKIKVNISIFGRSTPVELEYWQVEKV
ncbi:MAG TPA: transcription termination/antitermination protein NusG [Candidatus Omnitrophota bacterium]|nr:transcription termination/antitermination protein NusG [Candidatus Omnitrophota bacterium]HRZ15194.1 transcription termination/antitermination protein NusG [Candidatus Omnitrophota bacterium]